MLTAWEVVHEALDIYFPAYPLQAEGHPQPTFRECSLAYPECCHPPRWKNQVLLHFGCFMWLCCCRHRKDQALQYLQRRRLGLRPRCPRQGQSRPRPRLG